MKKSHQSGQQSMINMNCNLQSTDFLMRQMKKSNAYFQYKNQSLFKSKDTKADQLIQTTMKFQNQFNSLKTQMRKEDLKASSYHHRVVSYFNKPKQKIPEFMMKEQNLPTHQSENKTEVSEESREQAQPEHNKIQQKQSRNSQINPRIVKSDAILQQLTASPGSQEQKKNQIKKGHRKMVRKQQIHPGLRKEKSSYTSIGHLLRKQKQIIQRQRGWHLRNHKTNLKLMDAVVNTIPSSPKDKLLPKYKMIRPTSASSLASETISLISLAVQAREKQKSILSIAQQAQLEEEKEKKMLRKKFKQQFYYAMKNKKFQTDVFDSARERITDIPGINVRDNINVHSLHNFQQYFESVNAKAQNLVKICNYRTKQHGQGETPSQQNRKNRRMSNDLGHQISLRQLKSSETLFWQEYDREKTGILSSEIGNSVEYSEYVPPGYLKKTTSMSRKERQKYSINRGYQTRPRAESSKYSSMSTTLIQSAKNIKKQPSARSQKKYWSSSSNLINGVAPNTSMWGDQKSDTLSSTRILSKGPPSRAMSFYNTPSH